MKQKQLIEVIGFIYTTNGIRNVAKQLSELRQSVGYAFIFLFRYSNSGSEPIFY